MFGEIKRSFSVTFIGHRGASRPTSRLVTLSTRTGSGDAVAGWCDMPYHGMVGIVMTRPSDAPYLQFNQPIVPGLPSCLVEYRHHLARVTTIDPSFCESYYVSNTIGCTSLYRDSSTRSLMHMPVDEL